MGSQATPQLGWGEMQRTTALPPPSPNRTGVWGSLPPPSPSPGEHSPGTPILTSLCCLFLQALLPASSMLLRLSIRQKPPSPAAAPGSHCPLAPFQFTVGTADVTPPPRAHNLGRKLPRILALCSASAGTGAGDPRVPLKALPSSRRGSGSLLRHPRCPWAAGGWGEVLVGTLRSRCPA